MTTVETCAVVFHPNKENMTVLDTEADPIFKLIRMLDVVLVKYKHINKPCLPFVKIGDTERLPEAIDRCCEGINLKGLDHFPMGIADEPERDPEGRSFLHIYIDVVEDIEQNIILPTDEEIEKVWWTCADSIGKDDLHLDHQLVIRDAIGIVIKNQPGMQEMLQQQNQQRAGSQGSLIGPK